jgi:hypothetical protein
MMLQPTHDAHDSWGASEAEVRDCARQLGEHSEESARRVWEQIGSLGAHRVLPVVGRLLQEEDPGVRAGAAEIVGEIGGRDEMTALLGLLDDESPEVSRAAALAYARLASDPRAALHALELLDARSSAETRAVPRSAVQTADYRATLYTFPAPDGAAGLNEPGARLLSAARVTDEKGQFVALFEVRRDAARDTTGARLDMYDGRVSTRLGAFRTPPSESDLVAAIEVQLAQRCPECSLFARAEARFCRGCGSSLVAHLLATNGGQRRIELTASDVAELVHHLAWKRETNEPAVATLRAEVARGAPVHALEAMWDAFQACAPHEVADRERLARMLATLVVARGVDSLEEALAFQRARGIGDSGVLYRALQILFPRSIWRPGDPLLADARLSPRGMALAVATRYSLSTFSAGRRGVSEPRLFFRDPVELDVQGVGAQAPAVWSERPADFTDGWVVRAAYGARGGLALEMIRFTLGSVERHEPALVSTLHVDPAGRRGVAIQSVRFLRDAAPLVWGLRADEGALAVVEGGGVRIHDLESGCITSFATPHKALVRYVGFSPDGGKLVTSDGVEARLWNASNGVMLRPYSLDGRELLGFDRQGRLLAVELAAERTLILNLIGSIPAGECPTGSLLHMSPDGILRCASATVHGERLRDKGYVAAGLGPSGTALFTTDTDVIYWDGHNEYAIRPGRYEPGRPQAEFGAVG